MKNVLVIIFCMVSQFSFSQFAKVEIDFKKPESVVNALIFAANKSELSILNCICDPVLEGNDSVKFLKQLKEDGGNAALGNEEAMKRIKIFYDDFIGATITGETEYEQQDKYFFFAYIPVSTKSGEVKIKLIKLYDNWYIHEF